MRNRPASVERIRVNRTLLELFITFAKIGAFTFGGGYAMIPLIQREVVDHKHWASSDDILDVVAIAESTPGPIAINSATFIGQKVAGPRGAICATLGVVLPSFIIIAAISCALQAFQHLRVVRYAFWGVRTGVLALILKALWTLFSQCSKDWFSCCIMVLSLLSTALLDIDAIFVILAAGAGGILYRQIKKVKA